MNIKDFTYIVAVTDHGSVSKAAEILYLSQPSLSAYIHNLEKQLEIQFFQKDRKALTPEGSLYVDYARRIIELDKELTNELEKMKREKNRQFLIGLTPGRSDQFLGKLYDRLNQSDNTFSADFIIDTSQNLVQKIKMGQLDLCLLNSPQTSNGLDCQLLFQEPLILAVNNDDPITSQAYSVKESKYLHLPAELLKGLPYIIYPRGRSLRATFDVFCQKLDFMPKIVQEVPSVRSACQLVSLGFGATFLFDVPQELNYLNSNASCYYIDDIDLTVDYILAYDKKTRITPDFKKVMNEIKKIILA